MLRTNRLQGFWASSNVGPTPSSGLSPVLPTYAWTFDDPYNTITDVIAGKLLTINSEWGGFSYPSKRGIALVLGSGSGSAETGIYGEKQSASGFVFMGNSENVTWVRFESTGGTYAHIRTSKVDSSSFDVSLYWFDGGTANNTSIATGLSINQYHYFGLSVNYTNTEKQILAVVNGSETAVDYDVPDGVSNTLAFNDTSGATSGNYYDELYAWQGTALLAENFKWLRNNGIGRFLQGTGADATW